MKAKYEDSNYIEYTVKSETYQFSRNFYVPIEDGVGMREVIDAFDRAIEICKLREDKRKLEDQIQRLKNEVQKKASSN